MGLKSYGNKTHFSYLYKRMRFKQVQVRTRKTRRVDDIIINDRAAKQIICNEKT